MGRRNKQGLRGGLGEGAGGMKSVAEDFDIDLDGEEGQGGRPRVKPEEKIPPNYENINLVDPNDEVLF